MKDQLRTPAILASSKGSQHQTHTGSLERSTHLQTVLLFVLVPTARDITLCIWKYGC